MKSSGKYQRLIIAGLLLLLTFPLLAINPEQQGFEVSGTVLSGDNYPIPGVNVIIKGSAKGTVTGRDGNFSITVPDENTVLYFSSLGYLPTEITVGPNRVFSVTLNRTGIQSKSDRELMEMAREDMKKQIGPDWELFQELMDKAREDMQKQIEPDWELFRELMEKAREDIRRQLQPD